MDCEAEAEADADAEAEGFEKRDQCADIAYLPVMFHDAQRL